MKLYQPNQDEKAFLYQQAFELESLVKDLGSLSVMVEEMGNKTRHKFVVTFVVAPEAMQFRVRAMGDTLVEATMAAREKAQKQLSALMNVMPANEVIGQPQWLH